MTILPMNRIRRVRLPLLGSIALARDPGEGLTPGRLMFATELVAEHRRADGSLVRKHRLGSGVVTVGAANTIVSDAVTGTAVVPTLARYKYVDSGTGTTAATDGDTALTTADANHGGRQTATLSNAQTANTTNHAAIVQYQATLTYTAATAVTEFGLFDAATAGNLLDHRVFAAINVAANDTITFSYRLTIPSNG